MGERESKISMRWLCGAAAFILAGAANAASADAQASIDIPPQALSSALTAFSVQSDLTIVASSSLTDAKSTRGVSGVNDPEDALRRMLEGTGLTYQRSRGAYLIVRADAPMRPVLSTVAAETVSGSAVEGLVVTAQKRREQIQDVPIAISAFSADALQAQKIEGGFDLLKAIPNVTFSKNNFTSYNFTIRGIGTKAVSVTTDPGVAVEFNNIAFIRNRLFEQEYFDIERVEVLRGPQGTLHGRNATAGVINVISNKAEVDEFDGSLKGEVGNYHTKRLSGFVNIPLIEDVLGLRFAGALTNREGYDYNSITQHAINGRDLWSGRLSLGFEPTEKIRADFVWERFNEDDDRSRTGKQLCHRDDGAIAEIGGVALTEAERSRFSQGCKMGSLYDDGAFGTPNGLSIPFIQIAADAVGGIGLLRTQVIDPVDPYGGLMQSRDLRTVASVKDPKYKAETDVFEFNVSFDVTDHITLTSQTGYNNDVVYSIQDYNRFNSFPVFKNTSDDSSIPPNWGIDSWTCFLRIIHIDGEGPCLNYRNFAPGGYFNDPQLGKSNTIAGFDLSTSRSMQFSQEIRAETSFDGPVNFSLGANYLRYRTLEDYYVMFNLITALAMSQFNGSPDYIHCPQPNQFIPIFQYELDTPIESPGCTYIDPNPIESINGEGHNYFRSKNPYTLKSASAFGEVYWQIRDDLKLTAGLRYTDDRKIFTPVPSQVLLSTEILIGGFVDKGYPAKPDIKQHWQEVSGRIGFDWKPDLAFTDETMLYGFYSRGYKGGGANPPGIGFRTEPLDVCTQGFIADLTPEEREDLGLACPLMIDPQLQTLPYPLLFDPEFVNAYELGAKNTLLGGGLILNGGVFFYDYKNYQVSQIKDRTAVNENFDATVWGAEFESVLAPNENLRLNATLGYQDTSIADGEKSIDLMNRTQSNPDWVVVKPWVQLPSNCIVPRFVVEQGISARTRMCPGAVLTSQSQELVDIIASFPESNGGQGFDADLSGNELPNAPHWTVSFGAQYGWDFLEGWEASVRGDAYWQSQSWARVYNDNPYDKLHGWYNVNLSFWIEKPEEDLKIEFYVKNLLDKTPITDAFLNSDDTALTTNVFVLDPRLIGLQITKGF